MRITNEMIKNSADTLHDRNNIMEKLAAMLNKGNDYFKPSVRSESKGWTS